MLPESNAPTDTRPVAVVIEFCVAVETVPAKLPVTLPVNAPTNPVAVTLPVLGLYVSVPSYSKPKLPRSTSPPAVKIRALLSFVDSLSVIVTVVAIAAVPLVF